MSGLKTYLLECLRLLYWAFFKPLTLRSYLRDIHPDLKPDYSGCCARTQTTPGCAVTPISHGGSRWPRHGSWP